MTDKRLLCAASMVRRSSRLADIGTDHAHLPVYLVQNGVCPSAVAADIGEGPAASARRTIREAGLEETIEVRVGDGLSVLSSTEADDIVIAGMGGETIAAILQGAEWLRDGVDRRLILQPMTKTAELRDWLFENGFVLDEEHIVKDGRHLYCVMAAHFAGTVTRTPLDLYIGALAFDEGVPYFEQQRQYLQNRADGLRKSGDGMAADRFAALANGMARYIENKGESLL